MSLKCANCDKELPDHAKFCSHCGQSTKDYKLPFFSFVRESYHELLDIDGRLWSTFRTLLTKPGLASYEFSQGKRSKYSPPLRIYLAVSVIFFLVFSNFLHFGADGAEQAETATELYSKAMFILFPMFALYIKCFYWQSYYLSNLVFSMHLHTLVYLALMVIGPLEVLESRNQVFVFLQAVPALYLLWYFFTAFKTMFGQSWLMTMAKTVAVYFIYMATLGIVFDVVLASNVSIPF